jgi:hypothetical protein
VANQNYVELERAESGEKMAASVEVVDYEANLALLQPQDKKFLDGLAPLELANDTIVGDRVSALQLEQTGALVVTDGLVTAVQVMHYPVEVGEFLTYRLSIALQYRDNSYTVPLVKNNKLAGLLLRYDPRSQLMDAIPAPHYRALPEGCGQAKVRRLPDRWVRLFSNTRPASCANTLAKREMAVAFTLGDRAGERGGESRPARGRYSNRRWQLRC